MTIPDSTARRVSPGRRGQKVFQKFWKFLLTAYYIRDIMVTSRTNQTRERPAGHPAIQGVHLEKPENDTNGANVFTRRALQRLVYKLARERLVSCIVSTLPRVTESGGLVENRGRERLPPLGAWQVGRNV